MAGRKRIIAPLIVCAVALIAISAIVVIIKPFSSHAKASPPAMALVKAGSFLMGRENGQSGESPVHEVSISHDYFMAIYPITYDDYNDYVSKTGKKRPKYGGAGRRPVMGVNWYEAAAYCNWLSLRDGLVPCYTGGGMVTQCNFAAGGYRLPTEAEWEYAARGGQYYTVSSSSLFAGSDDPGEVAWYDANSGGETKETGLKKPNQLGLYDMCGNLYEWCWDWYRRDYYDNSPRVDPYGPPPPDITIPWKHERARRGGSWRESSNDVTVASRSQDYAFYQGDNGLRLVRTAP